MNPEIQYQSIVDNINTSYKEYSLYTLNSRAIPSAIDGMKPVQRKLVYAMLQQPSPFKNKIKTAALAGSLSGYEYHHGEMSAQAALSGMAMAWDNNAPLFEGHGNFGSRKIQEAAAARYTFVNLSKNFATYFVDHEVAPQSIDNPEPAHYLPTIPWVLVNGVRGIAVGFATLILPRSPSELVAAIKKLISNPEAKLKPILPSFPDFVGEVESLGGNTYKIKGIVEKSGPIQYTIKEVPFGYDRETVINYLNKLVDDNQIVDYDDNCSDKGFEFVIKVTRIQRDSIDKDPLKFFKLEKQVTENITVIGYDGSLKQFDTAEELIRYFFKYRLTKIAEKIQYEIDAASNTLLRLKCKLKFVQSVISGKLDLRKSSKVDLLKFISDNITAEEFGKQFVNIPVYSFTTDMVEELESEIEELKKLIETLNNTTPESRYSTLLK